MNTENAVGWIGTGKLGYAIARRLLEQNINLWVYNRTITKADPLKHYGAQCLHQLGELWNNCKIIFICVTDADAIRSILLSQSSQSFLKGNSKKYLINCGTINFNEALRFSKEFHKHNIEYIDSPVSGGVENALRGSLTVMLSPIDSKRDTEILKIIKKFGSNIKLFNCPGQAQLIKIINNLAEMIHLAAAAEVVDLGLASGVDLLQLKDTLTTARGGSIYMNLLLHVMTNPKDIMKGSSLALRNNDLKSALELLDTHGKDAPISRLVARIFQELSNKHGRHENQYICSTHIKDYLDKEPKIHSSSVAGLEGR